MNAKLFAKSILFAVLAALIQITMQILYGIFISGDKGPPNQSFIITISIFSLTTYTLFSVAYILMGCILPVKNPRLKAFVFIMLIWASGYMPQVMGMAGADGPIAEASFSMKIFLLDSLAYIFQGFLLGIIIKVPAYLEPIQCKNSILIRTSFISGMVFPALMLAFDQIIGYIFPRFGSSEVLQVSDARKMIFYSVFYGFFIVSGMLLPVFYRLTEYNDGQPSGAVRFASIYALCIWTPVVLIMIAFGTDVISTLVFALTSIISIFITCLMNGKLLGNSN